ncbi:hypothetical protein FIBSPDRAFT_862396, partial [Athelia psychrophila]
MAKLLQQLCQALPLSARTHTNKQRHLASPEPCTDLVDLFQRVVAKNDLKGTRTALSPEFTRLLKKAMRIVERQRVEETPLLVECVNAMVANLEVCHCYIQCPNF